MLGRCVYAIMVKEWGVLCSNFFRARYKRTQSARLCFLPFPPRGVCALLNHLAEIVILFGMGGHR